MFVAGAVVVEVVVEVEDEEEEEEEEEGRRRSQYRLAFLTACHKKKSLFDPQAAEFGATVFQAPTPYSEKPVSLTSLIWPIPSTALFVYKHDNKLCFYLHDKRYDPSPPRPHRRETVDRTREYVDDPGGEQGDDVGSDNGEEGSDSGEEGSDDREEGDDGGCDNGEEGSDDREEGGDEPDYEEGDDNGEKGDDDGEEGDDNMGEGDEDEEEGDDNMGEGDDDGEEGDDDLGEGDDDLGEGDDDQEKRDRKKRDLEEGGDDEEGEGGDTEWEEEDEDDGERAETYKTNGKGAYTRIEEADKDPSEEQGEDRTTRGGKVGRPVPNKGGRVKRRRGRGWETVHAVKYVPQKCTKLFGKTIQVWWEGGTTTWEPQSVLHDLNPSIGRYVHNNPQVKYKCTGGRSPCSPPGQTGERPPSPAAGEPTAALRYQEANRFCALNAAAMAVQVLGDPLSPEVYRDLRQEDPTLEKVVHLLREKKYGSYQFMKPKGIQRTDLRTWLLDQKAGVFCVEYSGHCSVWDTERKLLRDTDPEFPDPIKATDENLAGMGIHAVDKVYQALPRLQKKQKKRTRTPDNCTRARRRHRSEPDALLGTGNGLVLPSAASCRCAGSFSFFFFFGVGSVFFFCLVSVFSFFFFFFFFLSTISWDYPLGNAQRVGWW
jgi:hypothetical protein